MGFLRSGLTRALLKDSQKMTSLSEVLIISAMIQTIDGRICFNRLVRIGLSSQFLFGADRMISRSLGRVIGWKLLKFCVLGRLVFPHKEGDADTFL